MAMRRGMLVALVFVSLGVLSSAQRVAVLIQSGVGVPPQAMRELRSYTCYRVSLYSGMEVIPDTEVRRIQHELGIYLGTYIPDDGVRRLLVQLGADYLLIVRVVQWESEWDLSLERAVLVSGVGLLDPALARFLGPLGLLSTLDRKSRVSIFVRLYSHEGLIYANLVSMEDGSLLWILSDPLKAARRAVDMALREVWQAL